MDEEVLAEVISDAIIDKKIVGFYHGRMEYGPRALGHRTILVNPMEADINDVVNRRLQRTEFMPFAPVVLDKCFSEIFNCEKESGIYFTSKFMTITLSVKHGWKERIPGVLHVDCTARPQVIRKQDDPYYYSIVERFHAKTGVGCLVNTSFNIHEEPIVNSPEDAILAFRNNAVDVLVLENYLVEKNRSYG
jgi:carbamoyltransferase